MNFLTNKNGRIEYYVSLSDAITMAGDRINDPVISRLFDTISSEIGSLKLENEKLTKKLTSHKMMLNTLISMISDFELNDSQLKTIETAKSVYDDTYNYYR